MSKINELDKKIIKFLLSGSAYSDLAIVKNLGISYDELENSYERLIENGYLESYQDFIKNNSQFGQCEKSSCQKSCNKNCNSCCSKNNDENYDDIKVITMKAIKEFDI